MMIQCDEDNEDGDDLYDANSITHVYNNINLLYNFLIECLNTFMINGYEEFGDNFISSYSIYEFNVSNNNKKKIDFVKLYPDTAIRSDESDEKCNENIENEIGRITDKLNFKNEVIFNNHPVDVNRNIYQYLYSKKRKSKKIF